MIAPQAGIECVYTYHDAARIPKYEVVRYSPKSFRQRQCDGHGGHTWNMDGVERVPFHLPHLLERKANGHTIFVVEGEKDVESLEALGFCATTNAGGAAWKYTTEFIGHFEGAKRIVFIPDCDEPGRKAALERAAQLSAVCDDVRIVELDAMRSDGFDVTDWIAAGGTATQLKALVESAARFKPANPQSLQNPQGGEPQWRSVFPYPHLAPEALHGLAGDFVRLLAPQSEADPAALLAHFLCMFGCAVGPEPMVLVESTKHPARLNALLVGETARGRKGTARDRVQYLYRMADPEWLSKGRVSGLASGEGLIKLVQDRDDGTQTEKRILVSEPEFARVLAAASRDGSILSSVIRDAWDSGELSNLTKEKPLRAQGAHISLVADITDDELRKKLSETEKTNGFLNRFLVFCTRRSRRLPHGGSLTDFDFATIVSQLSAALDAARSRRGRVCRTAAGDLWWEQWYNAVPDEIGLLAAVTARAEAQVLRLSLIYALLAPAPFIDVHHLRAAGAVWDYAHASARYVFGESLGDNKAERLLEEARAAYPEGLNGDEQDRATGGRGTARARDILVQYGLGRVEKMRGDGAKAKLVFFAVAPAEIAEIADLPPTHHHNGVQNPSNPLNPQALGPPQVELREALI